jgi:hypothetical protein
MKICGDGMRLMRNLLSVGIRLCLPGGIPHKSEGHPDDTHSLGGIISSLSTKSSVGFTKS